MLERTEGLGDEHDELRGLEEFVLRLKLKQYPPFILHAFFDLIFILFSNELTFHGVCHNSIHYSSVHCCYLMRF